MTSRIEKTAAFVKDTLYSGSMTPEDAAYRWEHSLRVAHIGREIARLEGFDQEGMTIACLLHDIAYGGQFPENHDWRNHGRDGADMARPFLETLELSPELLEDICYGIAIHVDDTAHFPGRRTPFTLTVGDADNIDRFDVFRIYDTLRYKDFYNLSMEEKLTWLRGLLPRLESLREMACGTPTAAALWQDKVDYQINFYRRLLEQMENSALSAE